jgi:hypothetical protein
MKENIQICLKLSIYVLFFCGCQNMSKKVLKQLGDLQLGDFVEVSWLDASRGRLETVEEMREAGASGAEIDLPVTSYGIYIGAFGKIAKHIVLVASQWLFAQGYGQIDCTIIPVGTVQNINVLKSKLMDAENVRVCQQAFIHGRARRLMRRVTIFGNEQ